MARALEPTAREGAVHDSELAYGDCGVCPRTDFRLRAGKVPVHHRLDVKGPGPHEVCSGSGRAPVPVGDVRMPEVPDGR